MARLLKAGAILTAGAGVGLQLPPPWNWASLSASALLGFVTLAPKRREVVLRIGHLTWTRQELCRHFLITGDTGCGKTTSGFHPILVQLTKNIPNWGGLVLGVKGNEHHFIEELLEAHNRSADLITLQVRPPDAPSDWTPPHRYNLLSDRTVPWTTHAKMIVDLAASLTEGAQHAFFRPMAQLAMARTFELLDALEKKVTITRSYEFLTSKELMKKAVNRLRAMPATKANHRLIEYFEGSFLNAKAHEQSEGIIGSVENFLGFLLDEDIAAVFSSDEDNTFNLSDLDRGAVITLTLPQTFVTERRWINTYLKLLFYTHLLRRFDISPEERNAKNLLLLVADEFQGVATASEDGLADHSTIDRIREAGGCILAGMQSEVSADPAVRELKRRVLALNMRSRLIFKAADPAGAALSADFIGKKMIWKKSVSSKPFGTRTISRRKEQEHKIRTTKLESLPDHTAVVVHPSKRFIRKLLPPVDGRGQVYRWFRA